MLSLREGPTALPRPANFLVASPRNQHRNQISSQLPIQLLLHHLNNLLTSLLHKSHHENHPLEDSLLKVSPASISRQLPCSPCSDRTSPLLLLPTTSISSSFLFFFFFVSSMLSSSLVSQSYSFLYCCGFSVQSRLETKPVQLFAA